MEVSGDARQMTMIHECQSADYRIKLRVLIMLCIVITTAKHVTTY